MNRKKIKSILKFQKEQFIALINQAKNGGGSNPEGVYECDYCNYPIYYCEEGLRANGMLLIGAFDDGVNKYILIDKNFDSLKEIEKKFFIYHEMEHLDSNIIKKFSFLELKLINAARNITTTSIEFKADLAAAKKIGKWEAIECLVSAKYKFKDLISTKDVDRRIMYLIDNM